MTKTTNPLPPSDAVRKQKKKYFAGSFQLQSKKYHPSGNLKFNKAFLKARNCVFQWRNSL